jgi:hypothetical protein
MAQEAPVAADAIMQEPANEPTPETLELAKQLVKLSGASRTFDELLPNIADQAKNTFIRSNPQMQLGIVDVVDRVALGLVERRPELDEKLAQIWATAFETDELRTILEFYRTPAGQKLAGLQTRLSSAQMAAAEQWGRIISQEMMRQVTAELQRLVQSETQQLEAPAATGGAALENLLGTQDGTDGAQGTESAAPAE